MKNVLLIFIRNPEMGKVKTRLARTLGAAESLRIYRLLLEKTRATAMEADAERQLFYSDFIPQQDEWPTAFFQKKRQSPGDLGERMEMAFRSAFEEDAGKVLIIGSDCPELSSAALDAAFDVLNSADFVVGPVLDGGYYLLGMSEMTPSVFHDIAWSTETVLTQTLEKIRALGKSFALLPLLTDIDEAGDWEAYLKRMQ